MMYNFKTFFLGLFIIIRLDVRLFFKLLDQAITVKCDRKKIFEISIDLFSHEVDNSMTSV